MKTVDISLVDKIYGSCKEHVKETSLLSLEENSSISLFLDNSLTIKSIYDNYITFCINHGDNCIIIRNCSLNEAIPICLTCQVIKLKVTKITQ